MTTISILAEKIKNTSSVITGVLGIVAAVGGAILYVENNFANAQDVKTLIRNQNIQMRQSQMFQLEYYDDKLKKLEIEKNKNEELLKDPKINGGARAYIRKPEDISEEIKELKIRRDIVKKDLISETTK